MAKNNSSNQDYTNNSDGWDLSGGTTKRKLTVTGGDMTLTGSGTNTYTFPASTDTLVGRASTDTLTNKDLSSSTNILGGAWVSYTPTLANVTIGNGTLTVKYNQIGKTITVKGTFILGSTSSVSGDVTTTLPFTAVAQVGTGNIPPAGILQAFNGSAIYLGTVAQASTTTAILRANGISGSYVTIAPFSSTIPFTWGSSNQLSWQFTYEAA